MTKTFAAFLCLILFIQTFAQNQSQIFGNEKPYEQADLFPEFPGGESAFRKTFHQNLAFNKENQTKDYFTSLYFTIEKDGTYTDIQAKGDDEAFNKMAVKALKSLKTRWKSAENDGQKVRYRVAWHISLYQTPRGTDRRTSIFGSKKSDKKAVHGPQFSGGEEAFRKTILETLDNKAVSYPFTLRFYVERNGKMSEITSLGNDAERNKMIEDAVSALNLRFIPAENNGYTIRAKMTYDFK
ncbi:hypothetical protein ASG01_05430 [Chryseobacterium sp. Leaf180]|uniref:energy transducer TonB n=1 Tax=Chryseobacterium sp. Leaf180 TaxID=1736289 RepID=UPI0006F910C8|nr:hypothetical protein [Chryseobacterium sp. Leaf180]KQR95288.1 hypothetical protein ASG01_05430 [Chryseobacterium sp. Leaf180]